MIAYFFHWSKVEVFALPMSERKEWVKKIIEMRKMMGPKSDNPLEQ